jgi:hypothetical protein
MAAPLYGDFLGASSQEKSRQPAGLWHFPARSSFFHGTVNTFIIDQTVLAGAEFMN